MPCVSCQTWLGITPGTLRQWERTGELLPTRRNRGDMCFHAVDELKGKVSAANLTQCHARVSRRDRKADLERRREALESYRAAQDRRTETVSDPGSGLKQDQPGPTVGSEPAPPDGTAGRQGPRFPHNWKRADYVYGAWQPHSPTRNDIEQNCASAKQQAMSRRLLHRSDKCVATIYVLPQVDEWLPCQAKLCKLTDASELKPEHDVNPYRTPYSLVGSR